MNEWHIAQLNVGRILAPTDSPQLAEFMARLDEINALADATSGFVWRLQTASGNATDIRVSEDPYFLVNMSVWATIESLFEFVYRTSHTAVMVRRRQWFERPTEAYQVLWWVPAGHSPSVAEALDRLEHLRRNGPTAHAFTFSQRYPPPGELGELGQARGYEPREVLRRRELRAAPTTRLTAGSGRREHEVPSSAAVRALTVPSNSSEFGQTPQFRQGPDSSRRGYYSVRSVVRRRRHAARGEAADHFAPPLLDVGERCTAHARDFLRREGGRRPLLCRGVAHCEPVEDGG